MQKYSTYGANITTEGFDTQERRHRWAIVLAGGNGEFMKRTTLEWFGEERPEQFCCFSGNQTLLEKAWRRAEGIVERDHIITVTLACQRKYLEEFPENAIPGKVFYQPSSCGTAPAVLMAVAQILSVDPRASLIVLPSDHFIRQEDLFIHYARCALEVAEQKADRVILFGAKATWTNLDYGWIDILPEEDLSDSNNSDNYPNLINILGLYQNAGSSLAHRLKRRGALWNTSILAARAKHLWQLCAIHLPKLYERAAHIHQASRQFDKYGQGGDYIRMAISHAYYHSPKLDLFEDLISKAVDDCLVMPLTNINWEDWGRSERIVNTIQRYDLKPNFELPRPMEDAPKRVRSF